MKHPKPETVCITDFSRMRKTPPHSPQHWLYALLLMTAYAGTLWQHAHAGLTIGLLCAVPVFAASVYIPYRFFSSLARSIFNCFLFGAAICWIVWRMKDHLPDLTMVEGLCIASLIFIAGGKTKDCFYLFFISIFLLIYGALTPRTIHLILTCIAAVLLLILALAFRSSTIAGKPVIREQPSKWSRRWHPAGIQLILSAVFFWYIFALMPLQNNDIPGFFESSFLTNRENVLPPEIGSWLRPKKVKISGQAEKSYSGETPLKPTAAGQQGTPANLKNANSKSMIDGNGNASQGTDLLFYVKSPVKLYHLARLYDHYNGTQWEATPRLKRVKIRDYSPQAKIRMHSTEQKYTLVKIISKRLYAGFMPGSFNLDNPSSFLGMKTSFYGAELLHLPDAPLSYSVSVQLIIPFEGMEKILGKSASGPEAESAMPEGGRKVAKSRIADPAWNENISSKHYLELPSKKISKRVRRLAAAVVKNKHTPYERALALRDYLRNNYPYKLNASPVPPGKEPADYFLFEQKEGHCEYFACALAVMARSVGLPSRVATGFSPGNYNTLSNLFEVYEYHAHAWTQIYIERIGWLTMDATPPSSVQSRNFPAGLGQLRDPFDDEWRITPPELTKKTQHFLKNDWLEKLSSRDELSKIDSALVKMVQTQDTIQEKVRGKYNETMKQIQKSQKNGMIFRMKAFWKRMISFFRNMLSSLLDFFSAAWLLILAAAALSAAGIRFFRFSAAAWHHKRISVQMKKLRSDAGILCEQNPRQAILNIYTAWRLSLESAGWKRGTLELLDFADRLAAVDRNLSESSRILFWLYYKVEYGSGEITPAEARKAIAVYDSIHGGAPHPSLRP